MKVEEVTLKQLLGSLTPKHCAAIIATLVGGISVVASGAFWAGQKIAEAQSLAQQAEAKGSITQLQAKLEMIQDHAQSAATANQQWRDAYQKALELLAQKNQEVAQLANQLGRENNCTFIHEQIRATRAEMDSAAGVLAYDSRGEWEEKQKLRRAALEKRLEVYQQQLGSCNR